MFKRSTVPQRKPFNLPKEDIMEDIEVLRQCEEQRNKLFWCLDEKPSQEHTFSRLEEFLKGTNNLEDISSTLTNLLKEVDQLKEEISQNTEEIKNKVNSIKLSNNFKANMQK